MKLNIRSAAIGATLAAIIGCSDGTTNARSQTSANRSQTSAKPEPTVCSECEGEGEIFEQGQCTAESIHGVPCGEPLTYKITWDTGPKYYCGFHGLTSGYAARRLGFRVEEGRYGEFSECPSCGGDGQVND